MILIILSEVVEVSENQQITAERIGNVVYLTVSIR